MIRTEHPADYPVIDRMLRRAFTTSEEARLVERLRLSEDYIPSLSLVYETLGLITGHIMFSHGRLYRTNGETCRVAALAPLSVDPDFQRTGIGGALVREGLSRCRSEGIPLVFLLGHPSYYPRFSFTPGRQHGFELRQFKVSDPVFMVCGLAPGALDRLEGELRFSSVFEPGLQMR